MWNIVQFLSHSVLVKHDIEICELKKLFFCIVYTYKKKWVYTVSPQKGSIFPSAPTPAAAPQPYPIHWSPNVHLPPTPLDTPLPPSTPYFYIHAHIIMINFLNTQLRNISQTNELT